MKNTYATFLRYEIFLFIFTLDVLFPFLFDQSQSKASAVNKMSHLFFEAQKYFFTLFDFLKMAIFTTLFRR